MDLLKEKVKRAPLGPGCYLWKDEDGKIIYIGKAKSIRKRIQNYIRPQNQTYKGYLLYNFLADIDWIITETETEALLLEDTLIKKHQPPFNVKLKDDKRYPYLAVSVGEDFPRVFVTRNTKPKINRYFGPYTNVRDLRQTVAVIHKLFPIRKKPLRLPLKKPAKPCLNFHIGRCLAPCTGQVDPDDYRPIVEQIILFIEGKHDDLLHTLKDEMQTASDGLLFEKAARLRDTIEYIDNMRRRQSVHSVVGGNFDVLGYAADEYQIEVSCLSFRDGNLTDKKAFGYERNRRADEVETSGATGSTSPDAPGQTKSGDNTGATAEFAEGELEEYFDSILRELYVGRTPEVSDIYLPVRPDKTLADMYENYFKETWSTSVKISAPRRGEKAGLIKLAAKNARVGLLERRGAGRAKQTAEALEDLQEMLGLSRLPKRIECYDISHLQGTEPVASGVMFVNGRAHKSGYRRYKMKSFEEGAVNDPGMIFEAICRRLQHLTNSGEHLPDLLVIDGGLTQLGKAVEALELFEITGVASVGLAKKREELYFPYQNTPVRFDPNGPGMKLLRSVRDEAHRFAVTFHRERRMKKSFKSSLDDIKGLSPAKVKAVLEVLAGFESSEVVKVDDLRSVPGIGDKLAQDIIKVIQNDAPREEL